MGKTATRHISEQFGAFLSDVIASQRPRREIHVTCDNISSHRNAGVQVFSQQHRNVRRHYKPTHTSWLNQVENPFARIQPDVIARSLFTTVKDLHRKPMSYIREHNKNPKPIHKMPRSIASNSTSAISMTQWTRFVAAQA